MLSVTHHVRSPEQPLGRTKDAQQRVPKSKEKAEKKLSNAYDVCSLVRTVCLLSGVVHSHLKQCLHCAEREPCSVRSVHVPGTLTLAQAQLHVDRGRVRSTRSATHLC